MAKSKGTGQIVIKGAREHNLRNVNLALNRNELIVMTGVSGSGKSSLAFDTIYAEGQRRYVESLSSYARQFLGQMAKPQADSITGLAPSISIQQKTSGRNPRSTVGTITEIYDYLRVLYARVGKGYCPRCDRPITAQSIDQILELIGKLPEGIRYSILAPVVHRQKGEYRDLFTDLLKQGFLRARVNGEVVNLSDKLSLDRQMRHTIEVVIDRLQSGQPNRTRIAEAVESAIRVGKGELILVEEHDKKGAGKETRYSIHYSCAACGVSYQPLSPQLFSFNNPEGMCRDCMGLGERQNIDIEQLLTNPSLSLWQGAIDYCGPVKKMGKWRKHLFEGVGAALELDFSLEEGTALKKPFDSLPKKVQESWLHGMGDRTIMFRFKTGRGIWKHGGTFSGIAGEILQHGRESKNPAQKKQLENLLVTGPCWSCQGSRLNQQANTVRLKTAASGWDQKKELGISEVCKLSIAEAALFFSKMELSDTGRLIAEEALKEIRGRLGFLVRCGLEYLTLDRSAPTLSGGESQRIRLASQIGCGLVGVVYILDEPSIGLHPRDNSKLLKSLVELRDQGNTVIVVEHDEETMRAADRVVDFGPGPGVRGGEIVADGTLADLLKSSRSVTGQYLSGKLSIAIPSQRTAPSKRALVIRNAKHNNLKGIDVRIPLGLFVCITGVSGSGKSSLIEDILWQVLNRDLNRGEGTPGKHDAVEGLDLLDKAIDIDQSPIGRTPRSNPATYVKLLELIRDLYTTVPEAKVRGFGPGRFSFNVEEGRCSGCEGHGSNKLEMDFLADVWVTCPVCGGKRFNHETLTIKFKGLNIAEVLDLDVQQAMEHFSQQPKIFALLKTLHDVGLDYIKLGQPSPTLSGGEAQRIKLARELGKRSTGKTIYILDEPTTGLHFADIQKLLEVLHSFVQRGNTVVVVEHNVDVIKTADWVIDLGLEGGAGGGRIVAEGTPETVASTPDSYTGQALKHALNPTPLTLKQIAKTKRKPVGENHEISIRGASQHNLQSIDLSIPRNRMSVFSGPSGSGKTSLAMDTLYAEGQRRYVESLSAYARQFLGQMPKPKFEHVAGLSPSIAIEQKNTGHTPRSTLGTVTEIYDYLRVLYARLGTQCCPKCKIPVRPQTPEEVIEQVLSEPEGTKLLLLAPLDPPPGDAYEKLWERLQLEGITRARINGKVHRLDEAPTLDRRKKHRVEAVIDRITVLKKERPRIADSIQTALSLGKGTIASALVEEEMPEEKWIVRKYSLHYSCRSCGRGFDELTPHHFSFNSPLWWCPSCEGLGIRAGTNSRHPDIEPARSLDEGAITSWPKAGQSPTLMKILEAFRKHAKLPIDRADFFYDRKSVNKITEGLGEQWLEWTDGSGIKFQYKGFLPAADEASRVSHVYRHKLSESGGMVTCPTCSGSRLNEDSNAVRFNDKTMLDLGTLPLDRALEFLELSAKQPDYQVVGDLMIEIISRLRFLVDVGLDYLTLLRPLPTLSGGECQRIRLAGQIGRSLTGVLYVLDEPTIGLHPRDNDRLIEAIQKLRDIGNTLILVEHDREVLSSADRIYDFGPGAGKLGGTITAQGTPKELAKNANSLTGKYLGDRESIPIPTPRRILDWSRRSLPSRKKQSLPNENLEPQPTMGGWLKLIGAMHNNLQSVDIQFPLGTLTCVTGVSGSGKSSLIEETLAKALSRRLHRALENPGPYDRIEGLEFIDKVIRVDQQPIGNTPASNPATYTGVFELIRDVFSHLPEARIRGYGPSRFSFNRPGGRCDACEGNGQKLIEMHFLPDVWIECDVCHGKRFNQETLSVQYRGKSISDVLNMSIAQAAELFDNIPQLRGPLQTMCAIGLDYLTLGQPAPTLSGGESQRVKLAAELARPQTGKTLYLLDEPTTGLHFDDIRKLLKVINSLVELGNTVLVIEHNLDVIKTADWIIDIGPEAGVRGGHLVAEGTPEDVVDQSRYYHDRSRSPDCFQGTFVRLDSLPEGTRSYTGELIEPLLKSSIRSKREIFDVSSVNKKRSGDTSITKVGRDVPDPWIQNGQDWHLVSHIANNGQVSKWDVNALKLIIDHVSDIPGIGNVNWNHRSMVSIDHSEFSEMWFLHAMTGDVWLLEMKIRTKSGLFSLPQLSSRLKLVDWNETEIPIYNRAARIRIRTGREWDEIVISIHGVAEIDNSNFRDFLTQAAKAYLSLVAGDEAEEIRERPRGRAQKPRAIEGDEPVTSKDRPSGISRNSKVSPKSTPERNIPEMERLANEMLDLTLVYLHKMVPGSKLSLQSIPKAVLSAKETPICQLDYSEMKLTLLMPKKVTIEEKLQEMISQESNGDSFILEARFHSSRELYQLIRSKTFTKAIDTIVNFG